MSAPEHRTRSGRALTEDEIERLADDFERGLPEEELRVAGTVGELRRAGRPSLTGQQHESPRVTLRIPEPLKRLLEERAAQEQKTRSEVARDALEHYLTGA